MAGTLATATHTKAPLCCRLLPGELFARGAAYPGNQTFAAERVGVKTSAPPG